MPELPEVEEVRRTLEPHILGQAITAITLQRPDFLTPPDAPLQTLVGRRFIQTLRHGKKLFLQLDDSQTLLIHLGMSGRVDVLPASAQILPHTHLTLTLTPKKQIRFRDPRRFGGIWYYPTLAQALAAEIHNRLGPDALQLTPAHLKPWKTSKARLKTRLLSQRDVAGLGNIYVDESLWMARLHPLQRVDRIRPVQLAVLVDAIHAVLNRSISLGGTTLRDYRNVADQPGKFAKKLQAYGRGGKPCFRCQTPLKSAQIAGRTTVFCPICQKKR